MLQQQSAQQSAQLKQQELETQLALERDKARAKLESEIQLRQLDFELKERFEQSQHQRRLREIELSNLGKEGAASISGQARKEVQNQSARNQSKLIEQRKGNRGPLEEND